MQTAQTPREVFGVRLGQTARLWRKEINRRLLPHGLTESRWRTLLHLSRMRGDVTQKELAAVLGVQGPTLVRTLDWLESEGLIERHEACGDRRAKLLHLTERAMPSLGQIQSVVEQLRLEIFAGVRESDVQTCLQVFEHIAARLAGPAEDLRR